MANYSSTIDEYSQGNHRQFIRDLRFSGPNSNITVKDLNGKVLKHLSPTGKPLHRSLKAGR